MSDKPGGARSAILDAFNRLVLFRRQVKPRVADVIDEAGVARSTFYEHFDSRDSLLLSALRAPFAAIADAAAAGDADESLVAILDHFRENRRAAAELLTGPLAPRVVRMLAELISERIELDPPDALHLADMQIGFIRLWLTNETPYPAEALARKMIASASAQRAAFSQTP